MPAPLTASMAVAMVWKRAALLSITCVCAVILIYTLSSKRGILPVTIHFTMKPTSAPTPPPLTLEQKWELIRADVFQNPPPISVVAWRPRSRPIVDFFVRTWTGDGHWLTFMLRSIKRFVHPSMYRNIIVTYNESEHAFFQSYLPKFHLPIVLSPRIDPNFTAGHNKGGYAAQIYAKLQAHTFSDADYFLHIDSDCIFRRAVSLKDFLDPKGRVYLYPRSFEDMPLNKVWKNSSELMLADSVSVETMTTMPLIYPRDAYLNLQNRVERVHQRPYVEALMRLEKFNEFTPLGAVLMNYMPDRWVAGPERIRKHPPVVFMWSWGGLSPYAVAFYECVLQAHHYSDCAMLDKSAKYTNTVARAT